MKDVYYPERGDAEKTRVEGGVKQRVEDNE